MMNGNRGLERRDYTLGAAVGLVQNVLWPIRDVLVVGFLMGARVQDWGERAVSGFRTVKIRPDPRSWRNRSPHAVASGTAED